MKVTVTIHDCETQTFAAGGPGGQNQNKRDTGVRVIHHPSGARGESREARGQLENKKRAFRRMAESPLFKAWASRMLGIEDLPEHRSEERVRTYHIVDRRVKDHRTGKSTRNVEGVLNGDLDLLR